MKIMFRILVSFSFIIFLLSSSYSIGQDIIYKTDGTEIKSKILEIEEHTIKYKKFEQLDGPTRNISISDVFMIIYQDNTKEVFKKSNSSNISSDTLNVRVNQTLDLSNNKPNKDTTKYSTINFYRSTGIFGSLYKWFIIINGKPIWEIKNEYKITYRIFTEGKYSISVDCGSHQEWWCNEVEIDVKKGEEYFIKYTNDGITKVKNTKGKHLVQIMSYNLGKYEFDKIGKDKLSIIDQK